MRVVTPAAVAISTAPVQATHRLWLEAFGVFAATALFYGMLLSDIPVDDVARYVEELRRGEFAWDIAHLWIQPIALVFYRAFGSVFGINGSLEAVSVLSSAAGIAVFFFTLRRLRQSALRAALASALAAVSLNFLSLGPTAHIKLMVLPFIAMALHHAACWEDAVLHGRGTADHKRLWRAGAWIGVGSGFLVSILPMVLFMAAAAFIRLRWSGARAHATKALLACLSGCLVFGFAGLCLAYVVALLSQTTDQSAVAFVLEGVAYKHGLHPGFFGFKEVPFRMAYSLVYNFAFMPELGSLGRAAMWGMLDVNAEVFMRIARDLMVGGFTAAVLISTLVVGVRSLRSGKQALLLPFGFIAGAAVFAAYHNLNDPEHWFQFTFPLILIALYARKRWLDIAVLGLWLPLLAVNNLALYAIPRAQFDYAQRESALREQIGPEGLYIGYAQYPGEPDTSLLDLPAGAARFKIDLAFAASGNDEAATMAQMLAQIEAAFARGGRVLVFRAVDPADWRGPVMSLALSGLSKEAVGAAIASRYTLQAAGAVAGFPAWEVLPRKE